jgi:hypothetical protein
MFAISVGLFMIGSHSSVQLLEVKKWREEQVTVENGEVSGNAVCGVKGMSS